MRSVQRASGACRAPCGGVGAYRVCSCMTWISCVCVVCVCGLGCNLSTGPSIRERFAHLTDVEGSHRPLQVSNGTASNSSSERYVRNGWGERGRGAVATAEIERWRVRCVPPHQ